MLVEDAISAYDESGHNSLPVIKRMAELKDKNKLFINYKTAPSFINIYASSSSQDNINSLKNSADFGEYDADGNGPKISLAGTLHTAKDNSDYFSIFLNQKPGKTDFAKVLPSRTAVYLSWSASDFRQYYKDYLSYLDKNKELENYKNLKADVESRKGIDIENELVSLAGNEWGYAQLQPVNAQAPQEEILIMKPAENDNGSKNCCPLMRGWHKLSCLLPYRLHTVITRFTG